MAERQQRLALADGAAGLPASLGPTSLPLQINEILEEAIIEGTLPPGQRLRADDLAARYGVSRIPVREALRSLEAAGWIEIRPRYGAYVRMRSDHELRDLFDLRAVLEAHAADRAARLRTAAELATLQRAVEASFAAVKRSSHEELGRLSADFYAALHQAAHNAMLASTLAGLAKRARFYFAMVAPDLDRDWVEVHQQLVEAIEVQDDVKAAAIARHHIQETGAAVHRLLVAQEVARDHPAPAR